VGGDGPRQCRNGSGALKRHFSAVSFCFRFVSALALERFSAFQGCRFIDGDENYFITVPTEIDDISSFVLMGFLA